MHLDVVNVCASVDFFVGDVLFPVEMGLGVGMGVGVTLLLLTCPFVFLSTPLLLATCFA